MRFWYDDHGNIDRTTRRTPREPMSQMGVPEDRSRAFDLRVLSRRTKMPDIKGLRNVLRVITHRWKDSVYLPLVTLRDDVMTDGIEVTVTGDDGDDSVKFVIPYEQCVFW